MHWRRRPDAASTSISCVPAVNNLVLVDRAMTAQFDQILSNYCRIWRSSGAFSHSKLLSIDGAWSYVGSSNLDPRSLRLNFEIDLEVLNEGFATEIDEHIDEAIKSASPVTLQGAGPGPSPFGCSRRYCGSVRPIFDRHFPALWRGKCPCSAYN